MLRSAISILKPTVMETVPKRFRYRKRLTWPIDYLPFKWTYPKKLDLINDSGDKIVGMPNLDRSRPAGYFASLPELETAPEGIKRIFSLDLAPKSMINQTCKNDLVNLLRRHAADQKSLECKIASRTFQIRVLKEEFTGKRRSNKHMKDTFVKLIQQRNKFLKMLGRQDQRRYKFVKNVLEIEHTPFPLGEGHKKVTRKGELRRLTQEYADKVKEKKMQAYHEELKLLQKGFELEKKETEEWIAKEIEELKLTEKELEELEFKTILQQ